jgi:hypothetical protein
VACVRNVGNLADADIEEDLEDLVRPYGGSGLLIAFHWYRIRCENII